MLNHESRDGVRETRRFFLRGTLAVPAMLAMGRWSSAAAARGGTDDVRAFLDEWAAKAKAFVADETENQEAFLAELCAAIARQDRASFPGRRFTAYDKNGMRTGPVGNDDIFQLIEIELEPNRVIKPHNHVGYDFISLCMKGEARARHFEPEPGSPDPSQVGASLKVCEVSNSLLVPGRISTLTRTRANVHAFTAGEQGATFLDFGIKHPPSERGPKHFSVLEIEEEAADPKRRTFEAKWLGNIYAKKAPEAPKK